MFCKFKNLIFTYPCLLFAVWLASCGKSDQTSDEKNPFGKPIDNEISSLLKSSSRVSDLEYLLNDSNNSKALIVQGADSTVNDGLTAKVLLNDLNKSKVQGPNSDAELALTNLEESAIEHQRSIEELRKINANKDTTIASLSTINDELLAEVRRLKGLPPRDVKLSTSKPANQLYKDEEISGFHSEITNLKNSLVLKSNEIKDLRYRNDSLEARISSLENSPKKSVFLADPKFSDNLELRVDDIILTDADLSDFCTLNFDAVVTSYNGKSKEAFYTEFFIVNENFNSIMSSGGISLVEYSSVESYSELWAQSRKNSFLYPDLQKEIRSLLISEVENGNGKRVRTDINGSANVPNIPKGNYYIIGTAALGKIGVTWNVPIKLDQGVNRVSLTLANASWSM